MGCPQEQEVGGIPFSAAGGLLRGGIFSQKQEGHSEQKGCFEVGVFSGTGGSLYVCVGVPFPGTGRSEVGLFHDIGGSSDVRSPYPELRGLPWSSLPRGTCVSLDHCLIQKGLCEDSSSDCRNLMTGAYIGVSVGAPVCPENPQLRAWRMV